MRGGRAQQRRRQPAHEAARHQRLERRHPGLERLAVWGERVAIRGQLQRGEAEDLGPAALVAALAVRPPRGSRGSAPAATGWLVRAPPSPTSTASPLVVAPGVGGVDPAGARPLEVARLHAAAPRRTPSRAWFRPGTATPRDRGRRWRSRAAGRSSGAWPRRRTRADTAARTGGSGVDGARGEIGVEARLGEARRRRGAGARDRAAADSLIVKMAASASAPSAPSHVAGKRDLPVPTSTSRLSPERAPLARRPGVRKLPRGRQRTFSGARAVGASGGLRPTRALRPPPPGGKRLPEVLHVQEVRRLP